MVNYPDFCGYMGCSRQIKERRPAIMLSELIDYTTRSSQLGTTTVST
jgi:hypothetical protein